MPAPARSNLESPPTSEPAAKANLVPEQSSAPILIAFIAVALSAAVVGFAMGYLTAKL